MTENEIKQGLLQVCKVAGWDGDFNVVGFHALCDKLKELGAVAEREACAKVCEDKIDAEYATGKVDHNEMAWTQACAYAIRLRERS